MGERVLMQFKKTVAGTEEFGPIIYCHWVAQKSPEFFRKFVKRMKEHRQNIAYCTARLLQEAIYEQQKGDGESGFGLFNADRLLTENDTKGDGGVVIIDISNDFKCECVGGYLKTGKDGFPEMDDH